MTDQEKVKIPPRVVGPITTEEHQALLDAPIKNEFDPTNQEDVARREKANIVLGKVGLHGLGGESNDGNAGTVALVADVDSNGVLVPAHFAVVEHSDLGTRVEAGTAQDIGLPTPRVAYEMLQSIPKPDETSHQHPPIS